MRKLITVLFLLGVFGAMGMAQTYTVIELKGKIDSLDRRGRAKSEIVLKQELDPSVCIHVNENSYIRLVDKEDRTMYFLKQEAKGAISDLITQEQCTITKLAESYLKYLLVKMSNMPDLCKNRRYMDRHCHTTRGDTLFTDSIVSDTIVHETFNNGQLHRDTIIQDSVISDTLIRQGFAGDTLVAVPKNR